MCKHSHKHHTPPPPTHIHNEYKFLESFVFGVSMSLVSHTLFIRETHTHTHRWQQQKSKNTQKPEVLLKSFGCRTANSIYLATMSIFSIDNTNFHTNKEKKAFSCFFVFAFLLTTVSEFNSTLTFASSSKSNNTHSLFPSHTHTHTYKLLLNAASC